jgi:hypothetical protein
MANEESSKQDLPASSSQFSSARQRQPGRIVHGARRVSSGHFRQMQQQQVSLSEDDDSDGGVPLPFESLGRGQERLTDIEDVPPALRGSRSGRGQFAESEESGISPAVGVDPLETSNRANRASSADSVCSGAGIWGNAVSMRRTPAARGDQVRKNP